MTKIIAMTSLLIPLCSIGQEGPVSLRPDLKVEYVMEVSGEQNVRLLYDPVTEKMYYTSFVGEVYQIIVKNGRWTDSKVYDSKDHGITRLQGAIFVGNSLFLSGNISVNDGFGTKGMMMRGVLSEDRTTRVWQSVFITEDIGSTKTLYDHGFNGLAVSPDGKYIFVNSGARTDHGELQDNDGHYPGARDVALTACILRIPIDSKDLLLRNDRTFLIEKGYLFADGIRNAYDLDFSAEQELFAVSNSGDYDHPEDMFWVREGRHYGFPWVMGEVDNPQQYPDFEANHEKDPFLNPFGHAYRKKYFRNDPAFAPRPRNVIFTPPVKNLGPDNNLYRDKLTGKVVDADETGVKLGTFTPHTSPLGLVFDREHRLGADYTGQGFMLNFSSPRRSFFSKDFPGAGEDLMMLELSYVEEVDNYEVKCTKLVESLFGPTDAVLIDNELFILEYGSRRRKGQIWKVIFPKFLKEKD